MHTFCFHSLSFIIVLFQDYFELESSTASVILLKKKLDYEKVKKMVIELKAMVSLRLYIMLLKKKLDYEKVKKMVIELKAMVSLRFPHYANTPMLHEEVFKGY